MHEPSGPSAAAPDAAAIAAEVLGALDEGRQIAPFSGRVAGFDLAAAYRVTAALRRLRTERGERPVGRKLGFTNRTIWPEYGVYAPIWGDLFQTTVQDGDPRPMHIDLSAACEPRIEPEIAFGLARAPEPCMDAAGLMGCIGWVAHGVEIVQSIFPGWRFEAPDTVAAAALHASYILGPRRSIASHEAETWRAALGDFTVTLGRRGETVDTGHARNVLDGPLAALGHLVALLAGDPDNPPLAAGEFVTTGTVTRALPVAPGEVWETRIEGLDLPGFRLAFR